MSSLRFFAMASALVLSVPTASAQSRTNDQERRRGPAPLARTFTYTDDRERPRLGIATETDGKRDTLGLLVSSVTDDGPAARAGIEEGDRLQSINGVNLRLAAADAGEPDMAGIALRRLTRELSKQKIGDEVELRVYRDGQTRTVRVKTASADDLARDKTTMTWRVESDDRPSLGIGLGLSGSRRDTLGILIASVVDDGPADKARIEEGDRIAAINGVDLRVPHEDAGDWAASSSRMRRLNRELERVKAGDAVELRLYRAGQTRTVRVTAVARKDLPKHDGANMFFMGDGMPEIMGALRGLEGLSRIRVLPRGSANYLDWSGSGEVQLQLDDRRRDAQERLRDALERLRRSGAGWVTISAGPVAPRGTPLNRVTLAQA